MDIEEYTKNVLDIVAYQTNRDMYRGLKMVQVIGMALLPIVSGLSGQDVHKDYMTSLFRPFVNDKEFESIVQTAEISDRIRTNKKAQIDAMNREDRMCQAIRACASARGFDVIDKRVKK